MRSSFAAKMAAATAAVVAATGGLALAGALPAPAQHALAAIGIGSDDSQRGDVAEPADDTGSTTATTVDESSTVVDHPDNHGDDVSAVAHDDSSEGCEHGRAVSAVASGTEDDKPCPTTGTTLDNTTPGSVERDDEGKGEPEADGDADDVTTPTTAASDSH